ncbi:hypothetical protein RND71_017621 [Anisodus tanguticus]|uniref:Retrotransposon gag domain-containing protein n=1 Tax=Anisodus tanguticus TaxID=243964 RepID=A0AAE1VJB1_9SOLA|nr:hypothetical protein RND71_017621 [Anisodus tanguticus]
MELGRNKLGLVDGTWKKESFREKFWKQWERVNAFVLVWLVNSISNSLLSDVMYALNAWSVWDELKEGFDKINGSRTYNMHREITILTQGTISVSAYFTKLKSFWNEFESLVLSPGCNCEKSKDFLVYLQRQKLYQFLMELNETYQQERSQILLMTPFPSVNQPNAMIINDEGQKANSSVASDLLGAGPYNYHSARLSNQIGTMTYSSQYDPTALYAKKWYEQQS